MKYEKYHVAISTMHGMLTPLEGAHDLSKSTCVGNSGMLGLARFMCDSGRVGAWGEGSRKTPRSGRRRPQLDPQTPSSEIIAALTVAARLLALAPPSLRGKGEKTIATNCCRLSLLPSRLSCPGQPPTLSGTG
jgi:hypothetical protein